MKTTAFALGLAALLMMGGCKDNASSSTSAAGSSTPAVAQPSAHSDPEQLGQIGAEIKKHPDDATRILSDHGMTEASFETAIRSVSSDPAASRKYRDAYRKAGA